MNTPVTDDKALRTVDREALREAFVSLFWGVIEKRQREGDFKMADLALACGRDKTAVSHWFSDNLPNWTENTIADIARGLDVELIIMAKDRKDGTVFTPYGIHPAPSKAMEPPKTKTSGGPLRESRAIVETRASANG